MTEQVELREQLAVAEGLLNVLGKDNVLSVRREAMRLGVFRELEATGYLLGGKFRVSLIFDEREAENARLARTMPCSVCSGGI